MSEWSELRFNVARFRHRHGAPTPAAPAPTVLDFDHRVRATGLAISTARVPDGTPIEVSGRIGAGISEFDARLRIATEWEGECRRCLEPVRGEIDIDAAATFVDPELAADRSDEADVYPIDGDWVDVGDVVREEIMLALPLSPLCSGSCPGADPDRFPTASGTAEDTESDGADIDPRWAALADLTFDED